jgi:hypothetical protein
MAVRTSKKAVRRRAISPKPAALSGTEHDIGERVDFMIAALQGRLTPDIPQKRIAPGTMLPLELTDRERELILKHSFAPDELTQQLRIVPPRGKPVVARYTLDDLDDLAGYVAAESNHAENRKLLTEWQATYGKVAAILEAHTTEE